MYSENTISNHSRYFHDIAFDLSDFIPDTFFIPI